MAYPTTYTETTLAQWLERRAGPLADEAGWTTTTDPSPAPGDFQEAVDEALELYGASVIDSITGDEDTKKLRAIALFAMWRQLHEHLLAEYDSSTDGQSMQRNQLVQNVERKLASALVAATPYLPAPALRVQSITYTRDPYATSGTSAGDEWSG